MNAAASPAPSAAEPAKGGSGRLIVLLVLLAIMAGALAYDRFYAGPQKDAAKDRIDEVASKKSAAPVDLEVSLKDRSRQLFTNKDVQEAVGFAPQWTKKVNDETWECYSWWGAIPVPRNYLIARYHGDKTLVFITIEDGKLPEPEKSPPGLPSGPSKMGGGPPPGGPMLPGESGKSPPGEKTEGDDEKKPESSDKPQDPPAEKPDAEKPAAEKSADKPETEKPAEKPETEKPAEKPEAEKTKVDE